MFEKRLLLFGIAIVFAMNISFVLLANAADVTLAWDANDPAPTGYRIYAAKSVDNFDYSIPLYAGPATSCTLTGLEETVGLKFVARAYLTVDNVTYESPDSIEVRHAVIRAPLNLRTQ